MNKPFTVEILKDLITQYDREKISLSRFKELLNERAEKCYSKPFSQPKMSPKEKAQDLVNKMSFSVSGVIDARTGSIVPHPVPTNTYAKECAINSVIEILLIVTHPEEKVYWETVLVEIKHTLL